MKRSTLSPRQVAAFAIAGLEAHRTLYVIGVLSALLCSSAASGQEHEGTRDEGARPNLIRFMAGYSVVPDIESSSSEVIPALGFDYQRFVSGRLYVGTYNDLELTTYLIRTDDGDLLEREYAFVSTVVVGYDFKPWFSAFVGPGYEFETNKNFFVFRAGVEFMKELTERYTVSIPLYYDYKVEYAALGIGLAVAWKF